jgi:peptide subunit release factor RF-3
MAVERERGISLSSEVMSFARQGLAFNLLDTPVHQDVSVLGECNWPLSSLCCIL